MHISLLKTSKPCALLIACMLTFGCSKPLYSQDIVFQISRLTIADKSIRVELARTDAQRARGLMHRDQLGENEGMWFTFEEVGEHCMWMKNTLIDLDVAFVNTEGRIINIESMQANTLKPHCAKGPARYALEMNQGWFSGNQVEPGDLIEEKP